jgi:hypothetical protein
MKSCRDFSLSAVVAAALASGSMAHAQGYSVTTYAFANVGGGEQEPYALYDYNYALFDQFNGIGSYNSSYAYSSGTPGVYGGYFTSSAGGSGPTTPLPNLTSAAVTATISDQFQPAQGCCGYPFQVNAGASAFGNLASGTLGVAANGSPSIDSGQTTPAGTAVAILADTLQFTVAGAGPTTLTPISVSFTADGTIGGPTSGVATINPLLYFGNAVFNATIVENIANPVPTLAGGQPSYNGWETETYAFNGGDLSFSGVYLLEGPTDDLGLEAYLGASCGGGITCDYYDPAQVTLSLPAGVTYTSASGVFDTVGAPEPTTWSMMLVGLGGLGAAIRIRRKSAPHAEA